MSRLTDRVVLTHADKHTGTWDKLQRYWEQQLKDLREKNDGDLTEVETAKLRGRIQQIKAFLSMDKDVPHVEFHPHTDFNAAE